LLARRLNSPVGQARIGETVGARIIKTIGRTKVSVRAETICDTSSKTICIKPICKTGHPIG